MAKLFHLKVNTPSGIFFEDEVYQVELCTKEGRLAILPDHSPLIGAIIPSICYIRDNRGNRLPAVINYGIFQTDGKVINITSDFFDFINENIDSAFKLRQEQIQKAILNKNLSDSTSFEKIKIKLEQEFNKLRELAKK